MRKTKVIKASRRGSLKARPSRRKGRLAADRTTSLTAASSDGIFPVVGIGASAGGLEAMTQLLKALPQAPGLALVLVQHLDPTHESALCALLSRATSMPVNEARNNVRLEANRVYVIPPNRLLELKERRLQVIPRRDSRQIHRPIDHFLVSLAEAERDRAIGVILSGSGSDGTRGLLAIRVAGGITFAQDEALAEFHGMPASAIAARCVDHVLPPEQIARELARIADLPAFPSRGTCDVIESQQPTAEGAFNKILAILRRRTGVDFTHYRHATLQRRIQRRMVLRKFESLPAYAGHLQVHATEFRDLFDDILIHPTGFFREARLYRAFGKKLFPALVKNKAAREPIRIWVPGCSTGQEVYSIAIALEEFMTEHKQQFPVQIFGTDIHDSALEKARAGVFSQSIEADISAERMRRFFRKTEDGYRVNKSIREMCIFARQNLAVDPPFSNLDLISCRDVLIHLGAVLQHRVLSLFHYAIKSNGFLVLGATETVCGFSDLFGLLDKKLRIYTKKPARPLSADPFSRFSPDPGVTRGPQEPGSPILAGPFLSELQKQADRILLTNYCPAGVIINQHMEVLQFRGATGLFLEHTFGETNPNLLAIAREGLTQSLHAALTKATQRNVRVLRPGVRVRQSGYAVEATVEVIPFRLPKSRDWFYLVLFRRTSGAEAAAEKLPRGRKGDGARRAAEHSELVRLNEELAATRGSLQSTVEAQEATMEELRSANEEIVSSNEELQSTNEELETAKEELQSTNEELNMLNDVLERRNTELELANNDLHNVLGNINIPILVLGADLRIRRFTVVAGDLCGLIQGDIGRPITDLNLQLEGPDLSKAVLEAIDKLATRELEFKDRSGHRYSARICPYKTIDNRIEGAIIAFMGPEPLKAGAEQVRQLRIAADAFISTMREPVLVLDKSLVVYAANQPFYRAFQVAPQATLNRRVYDLGNAQWNIPKLRMLLEEILPRNSNFDNFEVEHSFPHLGHRTMVLNARRFAVDGGDQELVLLAIEPLAENKPQ